jgi:hypothetical protein
MQLQFPLPPFAGLLLHPLHASEVKDNPVTLMDGVSTMRCFSLITILLHSVTSL